MASRVMHLAIVQALLPRQAWKDPEALVFGALLPDAMPPGSNSRMSHFVACQRGMRCYDLKEFRRLYGDKLAEEGLYLGYYLHLIQDIVYRRFLYGPYNLHFRTPAERELLYRDYAILNRYLIEKKGLAPIAACPAQAEEAEIRGRFGLEPRRLLADLERDFTRAVEGEAAFITREMAEEYLGAALALCEKELDALKTGAPLLDPWELAWNIRRDS